MKIIPVNAGALNAVARLLTLELRVDTLEVRVLVSVTIDDTALDILASIEAKPVLSGSNSLVLMVAHLT